MNLVAQPRGVHMAVHSLRFLSLCLEQGLPRGVHFTQLQKRTPIYVLNIVISMFLLISFLIFFKDTNNQIFIPRIIGRINLSAENIA